MHRKIIIKNKKFNFQTSDITIAGDKAINWGIRLISASLFQLSYEEIYLKNGNGTWNLISDS